MENNATLFGPIGVTVTGLGTKAMVRVDMTRRPGMEVLLDRPFSVYLNIARATLSVATGEKPYKYEFIRTGSRANLQPGLKFYAFARCNRAGQDFNILSVVPYDEYVEFDEQFGDLASKPYWDRDEPPARPLTTVLEIAGEKILFPATMPAPVEVQAEPAVEPLNVPAKAKKPKARDEVPDIRKSKRIAAAPRRKSVKSQLAAMA